MAGVKRSIYQGETPLLFSASLQDKWQQSTFDCMMSIDNGSAENAEAGTQVASGHLALPFT